VPLAGWFRGPLRQRVRTRLCGPVLHESGLFDMTAIARLLDRHQSGERDHSAALWSLSMVESFLRQVDAGGADAEAEAEKVGSAA